MPLSQLQQERCSIRQLAKLTGLTKGTAEKLLKQKDKRTVPLSPKRTVPLSPLVSPCLPLSPPLSPSGLTGLRFIGFLDEVQKALGKAVDLFDVRHIEPGSLIDQEIRTTGVTVYEK